ncbi:3',5'-bisphosphate nucleotidase [Lactarius akahatsu]|uniref:3'(2'),5'-bisphosphate nucleotidase n=1 Tax=Lactarius akahatsu TaxID=416441 RepID=A0AAD4LMP7_9AGAM|nr:3',5'-bisphosphate nucleotidase [Lactarius akahatsu]
MAAPFLLEQQVAIAAVRRACSLTTTVFNKLVVGETLVKGDKSPVTVADFAAQAVINTVLSHAFPDDPIVGEEDAADLRTATPESDALRARVVELADDVLAQLPREHAGERAEWGLGRRWGSDALLGAIDRGCHVGGRAGRMWTLDPIDGTKGFLRGGQYAVCLALLVDARVELGIIGCPNLPADTDTDATTDDKGALFVAVRGHGAHQLPLEPSTQQQQQQQHRLLHMPRLALHDLSFLESVEKAHAALDTNARVAARLGVRAAPVRMDSQAKYAALARGGGGVYLRLPVAHGYQEKIWDHAPGSLLVEEAGGVISDYRGRPLDFGLGRTLGENFGVVAARKEVHAEVIAAVGAVLAEEAVEKEGEESVVRAMMNP